VLHDNNDLLSSHSDVFLSTRYQQQAMPYRRLPNTDNARMKALGVAHTKGGELPPFKLAFSQSMFQKIKTLLPGYENAISEHRNALQLHADKNKDYQRKFKKARVYISHFIQVVDMAITRGEHPPSVRSYFGLDEKERKLPGLASEEEVLLWGKLLIEGEKNRRLSGLAPITNPTIAVVKVHYDKFLEAHNQQKSLKKRVARAHETLENLRSEADEIIQHTWNEVEDTFKDLPEEIRREKSAEYGVVYVFRKHELNGLNLFQAKQIG